MDEVRSLAIGLREYLKLSKKERRAISHSAVSGRRRDLYARAAMFFLDGKQQGTGQLVEDFLAAKAKAPDGTSNAAVGRSLGITRQLAYKRAKWARDRMEEMRKAAQI